uniref:Uncharacterized protein n=1 Tax=Cereibacter sphaeroides (strain ATCC 17025 / ATH 2.4.3) TaxID=349102 RepID=A4WZS8_CERS5
MDQPLRRCSGRTPEGPSPGGARAIGAGRLGHRMAPPRARRGGCDRSRGPIEPGRDDEPLSRLSQDVARAGKGDDPLARRLEGHGCNQILQKY